MTKTNKPNLQELAEFMRDAAYGDNMSHGIRWSLDVIHPRDKDGAVGFTGGIWTDCRDGIMKDAKRVRVSISFSYSEIRGITQFQLWRDDSKIGVGAKPTFEQFKERVISEFGINELFIPKNKKGEDYDE